MTNLIGAICARGGNPAELIELINTSEYVGEIADTFVRVQRGYTLGPEFVRGVHPADPCWRRLTVGFDGGSGWFTNFDPAQANIANFPPPPRTRDRDQTYQLLVLERDFTLSAAIALVSGIPDMRLPEYRAEVEEVMWDPPSSRIIYGVCGPRRQDGRYPVIAGCQDRMKTRYAELMEGDCPLRAGYAMLILRYPSNKAKAKRAPK